MTASATGFCRAERLRDRRDFVRLSASRVKVVARHFIILATPPLAGGCRIGITVSRKVGNSVIRNRVKRLVREFYRNNKAEFPLADVVFIARSGTSVITYPELCQELHNAIRRIGQQLDS